MNPSPDAGVLDVVRIALVSDTHVRTDDTDQARAHRVRLRNTIAQVNAAHVNIVVIAGDMAESGTPDQYDAFKEQMQGFAAPVRVVPGNHDVGGKHLPAKPGEGVTQARVDDWEKRFGPSFWAETVQTVRMVGVNTPVLGSGLPVEAAQWEFLERELVAAADDAANNARVIVVQHYPLFLENPTEPGGDYWNVEPAPRDKYLALLDKSPTVRAILSGHLHRPLGLRYQNVHCIGTPPVAFGLPKGKQAEGWTLVTVSPQSGEVSYAFNPVSSVPSSDTLSSPKSAAEQKPRV